VDNNEQAQAMRVTMRLLLSMLAAAVVAMTGTGAYAQGTPEGDTLFQDPGSRLQRSSKGWTQSDNCGKESFQKFPDYTTEGAANRDAYMRECLRRHHLPPRANVVQPVQPKQ
jgi:hypothetical protein